MLIHVETSDGEFHSDISATHSFKESPKDFSADWENACSMTVDYVNSDEFNGEDTVGLTYANMRMLGWEITESPISELTVIVP